MGAYLHPEMVRNMEEAIDQANLPPVGLIAGNGTFPLRFAERAREEGRKVVAVCHRGETDPALEAIVERAVWVKVGELGRIIQTFKRAGIREAAMVGGINRVRLFGGVKLDGRGIDLRARIRSAKDDVIMRGVADELQREGITIIPSTVFLKKLLAERGCLTRSAPTVEEAEDIRIGVEALRQMSSQDIGQLVVVRSGVIVAVEAVEGSDAAIRRGGELGGPGTVVVKFAKVTQDMRFDVPVVGVKTIEVLAEVQARVLAVEAGRCLIMDPQEVLALANKHRIAIVGCEPLGAVLT